MNGHADTKARLLTTARELFAKQGFDNTSVRQITAQAGANLGAVTYHFQSKEHLYHMVLESMTGPLCSQLVAAVDVPGTPLHRIEFFVRVYFDYMSTNRELPALILHEISLCRPLPAPVHSLMERVSGLLADQITEGQRTGWLAPGDVGLMTMSIIALPAHAVIARSVARQVFGRDFNDPGVRAQLIDHITAFLRRGLANPGRNE